MDFFFLFSGSGNTVYAEMDWITEVEKSTFIFQEFRLVIEVYMHGMKKGYINSFLRLRCSTETKPEATHATIILNNCFKLALSEVYPTSSPCYDYECNFHKIYLSLYTVWLFSKASPTRWFSEQSSSIVSESFWYSNNNNCESFLPLDIEKTGRDVYICMCVLQLYRIYRIYVLH